MTVITAVRSLSLWLAAALVLVGCGGASEPVADAGREPDGRVIDVRMVDIAFEPSAITVSDGETVTLRFTNDGQLPHDAFIGDAAAQDAHGEEMAEAGDGGHGGHDGHGEEGTAAVTVEPGQVIEIDHTFTAGDTVMIGCHQPGHYDAGMVLDVEVT